jgi:hypothetical protein
MHSHVRQRICVNLHCTDHCSTTLPSFAQVHIHCFNNSLYLQSTLRPSKLGWNNQVWNDHTPVAVTRLLPRQSQTQPRLHSINDSPLWQPPSLAADNAPDMQDHNKCAIAAHTKPLRPEASVAVWPSGCQPYATTSKTALQHSPWCLGGTTCRCSKAVAFTLTHACASVFQHSSEAAGAIRKCYGTSSSCQQQ